MEIAHEPFLFTSCDASKDSLLCCAHSIVFLMHRNSLIKIVHTRFQWIHFCLCLTVAICVRFTRAIRFIVVDGNFKTVIKVTVLKLRHR